MAGRYRYLRTIGRAVLGGAGDTPLEARVFNACTLLMGLLCLGISLSDYLFISRLNFFALAGGAIISCVFYLYSRKTGMWRPLMLPGCLICLCILCYDWLLDPCGFYGGDYFGLFVLLAISSILLGGGSSRSWQAFPS